MGLAAATGVAFAKKDEPLVPLNEADFEKSKSMYFQRCAGCHGVLRKGATGKSLEPVKTKKKGQKRLERIIALGTEGGMNNFDDIFSKEEIKMLATYIQMEAPIPPEMPLSLMKERHKVYIEPKDYPTKPLHGRNWENFFVVIERDAGNTSSRRPSITKRSTCPRVSLLVASGTPRAVTAR
jgi:nitrite reductase (NO-forming)/hydroxylamine reductase